MEWFFMKMDLKFHELIDWWPIDDDVNDKDEAGIWSRKLF